MLRCQEQQRRAVPTKASISAFATGQLASPSLANAPSEDFADHSSDVVTSSLNYLQRVESLISGPACDAPLWFLDMASIRIALRGFLDFVLASSRPFPHFCFLAFTVSGCRFISGKTSLNSLSKLHAFFIYNILLCLSFYRHAFNFIDMPLPIFVP